MKSDTTLLFLTLIFLNVVMVNESVYSQEVENATLQVFMGTPKYSSQVVWDNINESSQPAIIAANNGHLIAFQGISGKYKLSSDGGITWGDEQPIGENFVHSGVVINENTGDILLVHSGSQGKGILKKSTDNGQNWIEQEINFTADGLGNYPHHFASKTGITMRFGEKKGRLLIPVKILQPDGTDSLQWRPYQYCAAIYSDDNGKNWITSKPFPIFGNRAATLVEIHDGSMMFNAREIKNQGERFVACSSDGGDLWITQFPVVEFPDKPGVTTEGSMGGMLRLPVDGHDILLYSGFDADSGSLQEDKLTIWVSFDGGKTWPVKKMIAEGFCGNSNLTVGKPGTTTEGKIFIAYETGTGKIDAIHVKSFNMSWILDGKNINDYLGEEYALWIVYDGSKVLTDYEGWIVDKTGTAPPSGTCYSVVEDPEILGNQLIKMEDLTDDWKEALQFNWAINSSKGVTVVFRTKPTKGIIDLKTSTKQKKYLYASPRNGSFYDALVIEETAVKSNAYNLKLNNTAGYSTSHTDTSWAIFRLFFKGDTLKVYINEDTIPHFNAKLPTKKDNFFQFGNNTRTPIGAYIDWMVINLNGAYAPGVGEKLPDYLTGLNSFLLTLEVNSTDMGEVVGSGKYFVGQVATIAAHPKAGYEFVNWTIEDEIISTENTLKYLMPSDNVLIRANFKDSLISALGDVRTSPEISVFPNPATNQVSVNGMKEAVVTIFNLQGVAVSQFTMKENRELINIDKYTNGVYLLKIQLTNQVFHTYLLKK
jgi:sialidase-1